MSIICVIILCFYFFFFFKKKTAYEMRISDWSSDVCSSDLGERVSEFLQSVVLRALRCRGHQTPAFLDFEARRDAGAMLLVEFGAKARPHIKPGFDDEAVKAAALRCEMTSPAIVARRG